nr:unnamed protein product [Spirometra erinaceieuropaei]
MRIHESGIDHNSDTPTTPTIPSTTPAPSPYAPITTASSTADTDTTDLSCPHCPRTFTSRIGLWGKYISPDEVDASEFRKNEVLHWSGGTYVVLPTILPQDLQKLFDVSKPLAVSNPGSKKSRLVLRTASPRDAGLYVCSVITESGRDDHKFVHVHVKDDSSIEMPTDQKNATPRKLTIYIAVPICVFLICFCAVVSLIIRNRGRRNRQRIVNHRSQKFFLNQGKLGTNSSNHYLDHSSLAGSNSMGFSRSGSPRVRSVPSNADRPSGHMQMRPSPVSTTDNSTQHAPSSISPNHLHSMPYLYPSPATECAYFPADGSGQCPIAYGGVPYGPTSTPAQPNNFLKGHLGGVEYPHFSTGGMHHPPNSNPSMPCNGGLQQTAGSGSSGGLKGVHSGFQQCSVESSACTDLGFDQPSPPFSTTHYNFPSQEPEGRVLCVSPSSGPESTAHLRHMQITGSEST